MCELAVGERRNVLQRPWYFPRDLSLLPGACSHKQVFNHRKVGGNLLLEQFLLGLYILQQDVEAFEVRCILQLVVQIVFDTSSSRRKVNIGHFLPKHIDGLLGRDLGTFGP